MEIADVNNQAVDVFNSGELKRSLPLFRMALEQILSQLQEKESCSVAASSEATACNQIHSKANATGETQNLVLDPLLNDSIFSMSHPLVHCHGIRIAGLKGGVDATSLSDIVVLASIVLFNLGLTYHLKGIQHNSSKWLLIAESHYKKSMSVLVGIHIGSANAVLDLLSMALLNNMAHIRFELCDFIKSRAHIGQLLQILSFVDSQRYGDTPISSFMSMKKFEFFLNSFVLQQASNSAPSA